MYGVGRKLFDEVNAEMKRVLGPLCREKAANIRRIVKNTIPEHLKGYADGFAATWISFYSGIYFYEALYNKGFLVLPEKEDNTPVACSIYEY